VCIDMDSSILLHQQSATAAFGTGEDGLNCVISLDIVCWVREVLLLGTYCMYQPFVKHACMICLYCCVHLLCVVKVRSYNVLFVDIVLNFLI
jgi:hypothetical protein